MQTCLPQIGPNKPRASFYHQCKQRQTLWHILDWELCVPHNVCDSQSFQDLQWKLVSFNYSNFKNYLDYHSTVHRKQTKMEERKKSESPLKNARVFQELSGFSLKNTRREWVLLADYCTYIRFLFHLVRTRNSSIKWDLIPKYIASILNFWSPVLGLRCPAPSRPRPTGTAYIKIEGADSWASFNWGSLPLPTIATEE